METECINFRLHQSGEHSTTTTTTNTGSTSGSTFSSSIRLSEWTWYPQQKTDSGELPGQHIGELKWLYGCGISDKIPHPRHTPIHQLKWWHHQKEAINKSNLCSFNGGAPALGGNPQQSDSINTNAVLYSHALASSSAPSSLELRTAHWWASTNRHTFPGSPWSAQPCVNDRMGYFHPRSNQLKPPSENPGR